jgi:hypothetical protein
VPLSLAFETDFNDFYFCGYASCCVYFIKVTGRTALATTLQDVYLIFYIYFAATCIALVGHLQAEYSLILGSYPTDN